MEATISLLDNLKKRLAEDKRNSLQLSKDLGINYHWLHRLRSGKMKRPGYAKVEKLAQALS